MNDNNEVYNDNLKKKELLCDILKFIFSRGAVNFILNNMVLIKDDEIVIFTSRFLDRTLTRKTFFDVERISKKYCIVKIKKQYIELLEKYLNNVFRKTKISII